MFRLRPACVLVLLLAAGALAQGGNGGNGDLEPSPMAINAPFDLKITGGAGAGFWLYYSDLPAYVPVPGLGTIWIDPTSPYFTLFASGAIGGGGSTTLSLLIPNDPAFLYLLVFLQAAVVDPGHPSGLALTRAIRLDFENPDSFTPLPPLAGPRALATTDLLPDGRILVAGGGSGSLTSPSGGNSTEVYDPYLRAWSPGPAMSAARGFHASAVLSGGRVLVAGGASTGGTVTATCEIYDPATGAWSAAASMGSPRCGHAATVLGNGKVLVTGGVSNLTSAPGSTTPFADILNTAQDTGEVYDPVADTWTPVSNTMASKRFAHTQTLLNDGRVTSVSGLNGATLLLTIEIPTWTNTVSHYNPATNAFAAGPAIALPRCGHRATRMPNGEVFVSGGFVLTTGLFGIPTGVASTDNAVRLNATGTTWSAAGTMPSTAFFHGQVLLKNGKVHLSGGTTASVSTTAQAFGATAACATRVGGATALTTTNPLPAPRGLHLAARLWDGSVLIAGGADAAGALSDSMLYTPAP